MLILSPLAAVVLANAGAVISFCRFRQRRSQRRSPVRRHGLRRRLRCLLWLPSLLWSCSRLKTSGSFCMVASRSLASWDSKSKGVRSVSRCRSTAGRALDDQILRAALIYLRAVGNYWIWIFDKIFAGVGWLANKIDGLVGRLEQLAAATGQKLTQSGITGAVKDRFRGARCA